MKSFNALTDKAFGKSVLVDHSSDVPYMIRYKAGPLRFHIMPRGDNARELHDHPWAFLTLPLRSYVEEVVNINDDGHWVKALNTVKAFRLHYRPARYAHRILGPVIKGVENSEVYKAGTDAHLRWFEENQVSQKARTIYTIVFTWPVSQQWGFYRILEDLAGRAVGRWVSAREYFADMNLDYQQTKTLGHSADTDRKPSQ